MEFDCSGVRIECVRGDIADQPDLDAVVNAANARLAPGSGVAGAIHQAAGPGLYEECRPFAPIEVGQTVVTGGHNLANEFVIHVLGPVYAFEEEPEAKLALAYRNVFEEAERVGISSIGLPAVSTGIFGYPKHEAAKVMVAALEEILPACRSVQRVRVVLFSDDDLDIVNATMLQRWDPIGDDDRGADQATERDE